MRLHVVLLLCSLAGMLLGGWLIGRWGLGVCLIADSVAVGVYALFHDDGADAQPGVHEVPTLARVLERARRAG
jgi:hypothetical protein